MQDDVSRRRLARLEEISTDAWLAELRDRLDVEIGEFDDQIPPELLAKISAQAEADSTITPAMRRQAHFSRVVNGWVGTLLLVGACAVLVWIVTR